MQKIPYDRNAAVAYAKEWALGRNPAYYNFDGIGGDCTNFASQSIFAGAKVMNYTPVMDGTTVLPMTVPHHGVVWNISIIFLLIINPLVHTGMLSLKAKPSRATSFSLALQAATFIILPLSLPPAQLF